MKQESQEFLSSLLEEQENKELLLKDLCSRLPYDVKVKFKVNEVVAIEEKFIYNIDGEYSYITEGKSYLTLDIIKAFFNNYLDEIKLYLFPLSSMTDEQKLYLEWNTKYRLDNGDLVVKRDEDDEYLHTNIYDYLSLIDWLHKNHIDYMGLIEKELAIDATGKNIY